METRAMVHGDQATMLAERAQAAAFLRRMVENAGQAGDLLREAAGLYEQVGKSDVWPWQARHYMADEVKQGLTDRRLRQDIADAIRRAGAKEAQAVMLLERARSMLARDQ